jgi:hypothetical protein
MQAAGHPAPLGDPSSGIMLVVEAPPGPRVLEALRRSLDTVNLSRAYVTWEGTGLLAEELLVVDPSLLVAVGPGAARDIDRLSHPLARRAFSGVGEGSWFTWKAGASGLLLPSITPALDDDSAKRRFWLAFLTLKSLSIS